MGLSGVGSTNVPRNWYLVCAYILGATIFSKATLTPIGPCISVAINKPELDSRTGLSLLQSQEDCSRFACQEH